MISRTCMRARVLLLLLLLLLLREASVREPICNRKHFLSFTMAKKAEFSTKVACAILQKGETAPTGGSQGEAAVIQDASPRRARTEEKGEQKAARIRDKNSHSFASQKFMEVVWPLEVARTVSVTTIPKRWFAVFDELWRKRRETWPKPCCVLSVPYVLLVCMKARLLPGTRRI